MKSRRAYLLIIAACSFVAFATPTLAFGQQVSGTAIADPVVEEPVRLLLQANSPEVLSDPSACGLLGAATIPVTLFLLQMLGLIGMESRGPVPTQTHLTDAQTE